MVRATQAAPAAAGMETPVPFHVVVRGGQVVPEDQVDLEEADRHHLPRLGEVGRVHHQAVIQCCPSIK